VPAAGSLLSADNAMITLTSGDLTASFTAPDGVDSLQVGTAGTLQVGSEQAIPVQVSEIETTNPDQTNTGAGGDVTAQQPEQSLTRTVYLAPSDAAIPEEWAGQNGLATLTLVTVGEDNLLVPARAVAVSGDGSAQVFKQDAAGTLIGVPVEVLGELKGVYAVKPIEDGALAVDDQVQVG
jgi:hypothetical protein